MSVLDRLKELSQDNTQGSEGTEGTEAEPKVPFKGPEFNGLSEEDSTRMEEMMQAGPVPGQSLTQDPESRLPYEKPPKYPDPQDFIDDAFLEISDPDKLPAYLDAMRAGIPLEYIAQKYLMNAFSKGSITPDVLLLTIEPIIYILISLATYANIDPELYPEDDMVGEEDSKRLDSNVYGVAARKLLSEEDTDGDGKLTVEDVQAPTLAPSSLLSRSKQAVQSTTNTKGGK